MNVLFIFDIPQESGNICLTVFSIEENKVVEEIPICDIYEINTFHEIISKKGNRDRVLNNMKININDPGEKLDFFEVFKDINPEYNIVNCIYTGNGSYKPSILDQIWQTF